MDPRISFVTLGVADLAASRRFYRDGLGWEVRFADPEGVEVAMIQVGEHLMLSLWELGAFEEEVGATSRGPGLVPVTLAHNVATREEVDEVLATARAAGADPVSDGEDRVWGGYTGYFGDPDGFRWEIAWNPGEIADVVIP